MPYLPIAPALQNWMFNDTLTVLRGSATIDSGDGGGFQGGTAVIDRQPVATIQAVVQPASRNDLERLSDDQRQVKCISVYSNFGLQGATAPNGAPDWVRWNGDTYQVFDLSSYERYGLGFTRAICGIVAAQPNVS